MTFMRLIPTGRRAIALAAATAALGLAGCSTDRLLRAEDPDIVSPGNTQSYLGAEATRLGAFGRLYTATVNPDVNSGEGYFLLSGLLADEWRSGNTFSQTNEIDQRAIRVDNINVDYTYRNLARLRTQSQVAIDLLRRFPPAAGTADVALQNSKIAQMYLLRGLAELWLAEGWCNGVIVSDGTSANVVPGTPKTTAEMADMALASFDSALKTVGTDTIGAKVSPAAKVASGRALVWLKRFPEAKAMVAGIPTSFQFLETFSPTTGDNGLWSLNNSQFRYTMGDSVDLPPAAVQGTQANALPFVSAKDPRVPNTKPTRNAFDGITALFTQQLWPARDNAIALLSGLDARLIEAEAGLQANDGSWLTILNALRATPPVVGAATIPAGLAPLADPGNAADRAALFFREKAFWQYGRGYRLGDMRRLVRQYGRSQATVFPSGNYYKGGSYGTDVNFPVTQAEASNPNFKGCLDRDA